jgi:NitT/TauT family transport system permease protein
MISTTKREAAPCRNRGPAGFFPGPGSSGLWTAGGVCALLLVWEAAALLLKSDILLPAPFPVLQKFIKLAASRRFLLALGNSSLRALLGILVSAPLGVVAGLIAGLDRRAGALLKPLFQVISATPVMSVILIAFLWFGQEHTPVFTAFLMVFPVMAANTMAGIMAVDPGLLELFAAYRLSRREKICSLYLPGLVPFILGGLQSGLSLCWKVVVAAEVLIQPRRALGTGMQNAKAQLETAELLAWTAAAVCAAALSSFVLGLALRGLKRRFV